MPLTKIYRVTCKTKYEHIQNLHYVFLEDTTDFINRFPISREIEVKKNKQTKTETNKITITAFDLIQNKDFHIK